MYYRITLNLLAIMAVSVFQISFIGNLPYPLNKLNLVLISLIFILAIFNLRTALWWSIGVGFLLDLYSFHLFGQYPIIFCFIIILINFLLANFFTNRSLFSFLALALFATCFLDLFLALADYFSKIFYHNVMTFPTNNLLMSLGGQVVINLCLTLILFYLINLLTKRLRPEFLNN